MRYCKFLQKTKLKQKFFTDSEKEVEIFFQDWDHSISKIQQKAQHMRQKL